MQIKFEVDVARKIITFFFKNGSLRKWVSNAIDRFPELSNKQLSKRSSEFLTIVMLRAMKQVCELGNIKNWEEFKPKFVAYNSSKILPRELQTQNI